MWKPVGKEASDDVDVVPIGRNEVTPAGQILAGRIIAQ